MEEERKRKLEVFLKKILKNSFYSDLKNNLGLLLGRAGQSFVRDLEDWSVVHALEMLEYEEDNVDTILENIKFYNMAVRLIEGHFKEKKLKKLKGDELNYFIQWVLPEVIDNGSKFLVSNSVEDEENLLYFISKDTAFKRFAGELAVAYTSGEVFNEMVGLKKANVNKMVNEIKKYTENLEQLLYDFPFSEEDVILPISQKEEELLTKVGEVVLTGNEEKIKKFMIERFPITPHGISRIQDTGLRKIKYYDISFDDIGGYHDVKQGMKELVDIMSNKHTVVTTVLYGPTGTGKTSIARSTINEFIKKGGYFAMELGFEETSVNFSLLDGLISQTNYLGKLLYNLSEKGPIAFYIDDVRFLPDEKSRGKMMETLERLHEIKDKEILLVMATNEPYETVPEEKIKLSPIFRPGRIDYLWYMGIPTKEERYEIAKIHLSRYTTDNSKLAERISVEEFTGAEIERVISYMGDRNSWSEETLEKAIDYLKKNVLPLRDGLVYESSKTKPSYLF